MPDLGPLHDFILNRDAMNARRVTEEAPAARVDPNQLLNQHMVPAMDAVGRR